MLIGIEINPKTFEECKGLFPDVYYGNLREINKIINKFDIL